VQPQLMAAAQPTLAPLSALTSLSFAGSSMSTASWSRLLPCLGPSMLPLLTRLDFSGAMHLTDACLEPLGRMLASTSALRTLAVNDCAHLTGDGRLSIFSKDPDGESDASCHAAVAALCAAPGLTSLSLARSALCLPALEAVLRVLELRPTLRFLCLDQCTAMRDPADLARWGEPHASDPYGPKERAAVLRARRGRPLDEWELVDGTDPALWKERCLTGAEIDEREIAQERVLDALLACGTSWDAPAGLDGERALLTLSLRGWHSASSKSYNLLAALRQALLQVEETSAGVRECAQQRSRIVELRLHGVCMPALAAKQLHATAVRSSLLRGLAGSVRVLGDF
jgi:hypothetical protein